MKNLKKLSALCMAALFSFSLSSCAQDFIIPQEELPSEISNYLKAHFPGISVLQVTVDRDGLSKDYDVVLEGGINLDFNNKYQVTDIESIVELPHSVIPAKILSYVNSNFAEQIITDWELDGKNQQVGLNNGIDLEFTMQGDFIRIDN